MNVTLQFCNTMVYMSYTAVYMSYTAVYRLNLWVKPAPVRMVFTGVGVVWSGQPMV